MDTSQLGAPQQQIGGYQPSQMDMYNYYKNMYDTYSGNVAMQNQVVGKYMDSQNPMLQQKQFNVQDLLNNLGTPQSNSQQDFQQPIGQQPNPTSTNGFTPYNQITSTLQPTGVNPDSQPGSFGLGTDTGQLLGQGGLIHNLIDPVAGAGINGIINPAYAIGRTAFGTGLDLLGKNPDVQGGNLVAALGDPMNAIQNQHPLIGNNGDLVNVQNQGYADYMKNPVLGGLKAGATIGSFAVPTGTAPNLLGKIGLGTVGGSLFGFGGSQPGQEVQNTIAGGVGGGITAGVLGKLFPGAPASQTAPNVLDNIDQQIQQQATSMQGQGLGQDVINKNLGLQAGANNARLNFITQNLQGPEQQTALQALANQASKEGDATVAGTLKSLYGINPVEEVTQAATQNGLQKAGIQTRGSTIGITLNDLKNAGVDPTQTNVQRIESNVVNMADQAKLPMGSTGVSSNTVQSLLDSNGKQIISALNKINDVTVPVQDIIDTTNNTGIFSNNPALQGNNFVQKIQADMIDKLGNNASIADLKTFQLHNIDPYLKASTFGLDSTASSEQAALQTMRGVIQDKITNAVDQSGVSQVTKDAAQTLLNNAKDLHVAQSAIVATGNDMARLKIPGTPVSTSVNVAPVAQNIISTFGKAQQGLGNLGSGIGNITGQLGQAGSQALSNLPSAAQGLPAIIGSTTSNAISSPQNVQQSQSPIQNIANNGQQSGQLPNQLDVHGIIPGQAYAKQLAGQLLGHGMTMAQIKEVFALKGLPNPTASTSPGQSLKIQMIATAYNKLNGLMQQIQQNSGQFGAIPGGKLGDIANTFNAGTRNQLRDQLHAIASDYSKVNGGKDVTDQVNMYQDAPTLIGHLQNIQADMYDRYQAALGANANGSTLTVNTGN